MEHKAQPLRIIILLLSVLCCVNGWGYFVFTQQWPQSFCLFNKDCEIPAYVDQWTIHGLWPNYNNGGYPADCNRSYHFNAFAVAPIKPELLIHWPNLLDKKPEDEFWCHEWEKHGTCCQDLPATRGELNYFRTALRDASTYNVTTALTKQGILPSDSKPYTYDAVMSALTESLGQSPQGLDCYYNKEEKKQYLTAIRFCLQKDSTIFTCPSSLGSPERGEPRLEPCWDQEPVYYPVIKHQMQLIRPAAAVPLQLLTPARQLGDL